MGTHEVAFLAIATWYDIQTWRERTTRVVSAHTRRTQDGPYRPLSSVLLGMSGSRREEFQANNVMIALIRPVTSIDAVVRPSAVAVEGGGVWYGGVVPRQCQQASSSSWKTMSSNIDRRCPRFWTKRSRASSPGARSKWIQTAYGNWIRWSPPTPRAVEAPQDSVVVERSSQRKLGARGERVNKALKLEKAQIELKRKVKALEQKCARLQQRAMVAEEDAKVKTLCVSNTIAQEQSERERELTDKLTVAQQEAVQVERDGKYCADGWIKTSKQLVDLMLKVDRCSYCGD